MNIQAVLVIPHPQKKDGWVYVPVINFPILPIGSVVNISLEALEEDVNDFPITAYSASNEYGTKVYLKWDYGDAWQETAVMGWEKLRKQSTPIDRDASIYTTVLDFNIPRVK